MPSEYDEVVREIGISQGIFTEAQARQALAKLVELEGRGQGYPLSVLLERMSFITETDRLALDNASRYRVNRDSDKEVARIIKESGYAPEAMVEVALSKQKDHYRQTGETIRLGELLVQQGALSEAQRIAAEKLFDLGSRKGAGP